MVPSGKFEVTPVPPEE
jgi:hypothetical protein